MMTNNFAFKTLLKKSFQEKKNAIVKDRYDFVGLILRLVLVGFFIYLFVMLFGKFTDIFLLVRSNGKIDTFKRLTELLTISYGVVLLLLVFSSLSQINKQLFLSTEISIYSTLPISSWSIYFSKLFQTYLGELVRSVMFILPINITIAVHAHLGIAFYFLTIFVIFVLPLLAVFIASIFALPYYYVTTLIKQNGIVFLICMSALLGGGFYLYSKILNFVKELLLGTQLRFFFNSTVMNGIGAVVEFLAPCKWLASITLASKVWLNLLFVLLVIAACAAVSMVIIKKVISMIENMQIKAPKPRKNSKEELSGAHTSVFALIKKELLVILRTPSYAFSYFSVAIIMPLMVYFCTDIMSSLMLKLIGVNAKTELSILLILVFVTLTNTFCSTNISREGAMMQVQKAYPISCKNIVLSKILLCSVVLLVSTLASVLVLWQTGYIVGINVLVTFLAAILFGFAQICFSTRYDLNHAKAQSTIAAKENSTAVSTIILIGLVASVLIGGTLIYTKIRNILYGSAVIQPFYAIIFALVLCAASVIYLFVNLKKKYDNFGGELA